MNIRGFQKASLVDFPGVICTTVFTGGCNFRCGYCHNRELVLNPGNLPKYDKREILQYLVKCTGKIDGVCITGGEPTLQKDLTPFIKQIKALGLKVKLDTNGTNPEKLEELIALKLLDYVAMDIKAPLHRYYLVAGVRCEAGKIQKSIEILAGSGIEHEFRTTLVPLLTEGDIFEIREMIPKERYVLQQFRVTNTLIDPALQDMAPWPPEMVKKIAAVVNAVVRGA